MSDVIDALSEGDIYRWSYTDPSTDNRSWGSYHCCSRIAIVDRGRLRDTYWQVGGSFPSDGRSFCLNDLPKLELTRLGNLADFEKAPEYQADYYDDADILNLNHANSTRGNFYLRKGASRSQQKMLAVSRSNLERSLADERNAVRRTEELRAAIAKIKAGEIDGYIPSPPR
jgi:hypothetical protein